MGKKWEKAAALGLAGMLFCALLTGCSGQSAGNEPKKSTLKTDAQMYSASYWTAQSKNSDQVLLSASEIAQINTQTAVNSESFYDLVAYPSEVSSADLNRYLSKYDLPDQTLYATDGSVVYEKLVPELDEDGEEIPPEAEATAYLDQIAANINLEGISATNRVSYALTLLNTSLRRFPTSDRVFVSGEEFREDLFLQSPLTVGEPVIVLHTSTDQTWYYVQLRNDRGWVYWSDLVFLEKSAWVAYIESTDFIVVTDATVSVTPANAADTRMTLYMGTVLPIYAEYADQLNGRSTEGCYVAKLPAKDRFGNLEFRPILIPINSGISRGFLPYTYSNVLSQAFKLVGEQINTRGVSYGYDADRFYATVYKTFGIYLPATLQDQRNMPGKDTAVADMSAKERGNYFGKLAPGSLLYSDSGAFLYLGKVNDSYYILNPATSFFVESTRYTANSILITPMDILREDGKAYYDAITIGREFGV